MADSPIDRIVRRQGWLEGPAELIQQVVGTFYRLLGPLGPPLKDLLHGASVLRHPLHPAVTDVPLGAWLTAVVLDYVAHFTARVPTEAGDIALAIGIIGSLVAVASGLTDYHETNGHERRTAVLHGLTMIVVVGVICLSLGLRWWGSFELHAAAVGVATFGLVLSMLGMYVGGHLTFGMGTMVNRNAFAEGPEQYVLVGPSGDFPEGQLRRGDAAGMPVLVVRLDGRLTGIAAVCSHAGGPLDEGTLTGSVVTCPWHGSRFSVRDGSVHRGPSSFAQPVFDVREEDGEVAVKLAGPMH
jgi:nitrite reductase/ring-hydroxylating ferredoxin subunit/uncharacterized membrane protein